jgi:nitroreductase
MNHVAKRATPDHPVHDLIADRWSPYVFEPRGVEREKLLSCLEAARWAASSFNEQPWSFLVAERTDETEFKRMLSCLMEANQAWAADAGVLLLTVVAKSFSRNNNPNRVAQHDLGLAMGNFSLQATQLGLTVHQMAGVELSKVRTTYSIPDSHEPVTAIAVGYAGDPAQNEALAPRDQSPRSRKPLSEFVFCGGWQQAADL